jgi:hypothetical protein
MADWSYACEDLRDIKKNLALNKYNISSAIIKNMYTGDEFAYLAEQNFKDPQLCENFLKWVNYIDVEFVPPEYKEEWSEDAARGSIYTLYADFFTAFVSDLDDIVAFMLHEYFHHVCDRILWNKTLYPKSIFTIKEKNFMEDMYVNAWIEKDFPGLTEKWQNFLSNNDMFHGLIFDDEEKNWNSLLTSTPLPCHNTLNQLYDYLREDNRNLLKPDTFTYFVREWSRVMKRARRARQRRKNKKKKKTQVKIRKPVAPPGWSHTSPKDYNRKREKKVDDQNL